MRQIKLSTVSKGEYIKKTEQTVKVYIKGDFIREDGFNRYSCTDADDMNREVFIKGTAKVWVGFTY